MRDVENDFEHSIDEGRQLARSGHRAISRTATRADQFADGNTALVAVGVGFALGVLVRRRT